MRNENYEKYNFHPLTQARLKQMCFPPETLSESKNTVFSAFNPKIRKDFIQIKVTTSLGRAIVIHFRKTEENLSEYYRLRTVLLNQPAEYVEIPDICVSACTNGTLWFNSTSFTVLD